MAQLDKIRDAQRNNVASQLGTLLNELNGPKLGGAGAPMQLGASLKEVMMAPNFVMAATREDANEGLRPTGQTLSLIEAPSNHPTLGGPEGGTPPSIGYVRHDASEDSDEADVRVSSVSCSDLGQRVSDAYAWIEKNVDDDPIVRLITAPVYHMTLLGLYRDEELTQIYVVTPPSNGVSVERGALYDVDEFRMRMREQPVSLGLEVPEPG